MHPNIIGFVASAWIVLSLLSGKLFAYAMEKIISSSAVRKCSEGGWRVRLDYCAERFGKLSCLVRKLWMDEPLRQQTMAGTEQTIIPPPAYGTCLFIPAAKGLQVTPIKNQR